MNTPPSLPELSEPPQAAQRRTSLRGSGGLNAASGHTHAATLASLAAISVFVLQLAWSLTVTPFRGIDEFDHVYRAEQVASGHILSDEPATDGRGYLVPAKRDTVRAAGPICRWVGYTGPDNCRAVQDVGGGYVLVASAAAQYEPFYYAYVGLASQPFSGYAAVYAQRAASGLLNVALLWMGFYALLAAFRTAWPFVGALTVLTPSLIYSSMLGQPNGPEMTAAFSLAACLIALGREHDPSLERRLLRFAIVSAVAMSLTRPLSPEWLAVDLAIIGVYLGRGRVARLWRAHRLTVSVGLVLSTAGCMVTLGWNRVGSFNDLFHPVPHYSDPIQNTLLSMVLWPFQAFGAFPLRQDFAPAGIYAIGMAAILVAVVPLVRTGGLDRRWWLWLVALNCMWLGSQFVLQVETYSMLGPVWQGRYALPLAVVVPILLFAWADRAGAGRPPRWVAPAVAALMGAAQVASVMHVRAFELSRGLFSDGISGPTGPTWAVLGLAVLGAAGLVAVALRWPAGEPATLGPSVGPASPRSDADREVGAAPGH